MRRDVYGQLAYVLSLPSCAWPHQELVAKRFRVPVETVRSIYMQEAQLRVKKTNHLVKNAASQYARRYQAGAEMFQLCAEADLPPCIFLRRLLESDLWLCNKPAIKKLLNDPASANQSHLRHQDLNQEAAQDMLARLKHDIQDCVDCDQVYSPDADAKRLLIGVDHEHKLNQMLADAGIAFWTEEELRNKGFYKTPDAKLQVPIAVKGHAVNWIDSKATFGDPRSHVEYVSDQFTKYVNRYGPGMVVYWFGFVDELQEEDSSLILVDSFPSAEDIVQLPCLNIPDDVMVGPRVM
ncbi:hypothetical protein ABBQ38_010749 [Trebouxia sp. C0009 RCD-2024]